MIVIGIFCLGLTMLGLSSCKKEPKGPACDPKKIFSCTKDSYCARVSKSEEGVCKKFPSSLATTLHLPFAKGKPMRCAQGNLNSNANSSHSNNDDNDVCQFAFDFASAANEPPRFVLASADGVAYVYGGCTTQDLMHTQVDDCNNGFGNMVKVDHGSGYYSLYAHLSALSVENGARVLTGDVLGLEGNTGMAGGKHIHWSLHLGEASEKEVSASVPIQHVFVHNSLDGSVHKLNWSQFQCGQQTFEGAQVYYSDNVARDNVDPVYGLPAK